MNDATAVLAAALARFPSATAMMAAACGGPVTARVAERRAGGDEEFRRVALLGGGQVLATATCAYRIALLTPAMHAALEGDASFGTVVAPLRPRREIDAIDGARVAARLVLPDGRLLARVEERYTRALLSLLDRLA